MKKTENDYLRQFKRLVDIMEKLREKCPWDKQQTHKSLIPYIIEEAYEVVEAIEEEKDDRLCEELGDLLLQIVFQSQIASERGAFDIGDVAEGISDKLIRRHPHVFGSERAETSEDVKKRWEEIKLKEKGSSRKSLMDGIPKGMPALLQARRIQERAAEVGFDWEDIYGVLDKVEEEVGELREAIKKENKEKIMDELGDLLFVLVNIGRWMNINPEEALRGTSYKFIERFKYIEKVSQDMGVPLKDMDLYEMEEIWQRSKKVLGK